MRIALIGCGAIASVIAQAVKDKKVGAELDCVYDTIPGKGEAFTQKFGVEFISDFGKVLKRNIDLVVEAASQAAVRELVPNALMTGKSVMIMSVGALADEKLLERVKQLARENNAKIYLPSGAIAGLDGVKSASIARVDSVKIRTRKHPKSLEGAPFFEENPVDLNQIKKPTIIYEGPASEAVKLFPANVNVAASLSIAGIGPARTRVEIIADPGIDKNIHEITVEGEFGVLTTRIENVPSPSNPRTSYLAALSAIATLKKIVEPVQVGT